MSKNPSLPSGVTAVNLVDHGFMDARSKLIDVAAFLDRVERHGQEDDYRVRALREAIGCVSAPEQGRARAILDLLSDTTTEPVESAGMQGAFGAPDPQG